MTKLPITVLLAVKNEALNLPKCLDSLGPAVKVYVLDSQSTDDSAKICRRRGAEVVQFRYKNSYPKKRQWALEHLRITTPWVFLLDADEIITEALWSEIREVISSPSKVNAFLIKKQFHFLGRRFTHGGFSHAAILLFRNGTARFERLFDDDSSDLDMEVHERLIVDGAIRPLKNPVRHEDFKNLSAYLERHNKYSSWESALRLQFMKTGKYGNDSIRAKFFGNAQERRRFLKKLVIRAPFEPWIWFIYHYLIRLGFLEGRPGFIACVIRSNYISDTRAKMYEMANK
ncbi:MAG TPA: glycosyltransferase family 2 protein [bacterium]|jgi:glycosyltransferase involved in cell wall biosynthesis|nr:glycosyltransferase family 2 protein [bacterium]